MFGVCVCHNLFINAYFAFELLINACIISKRQCAKDISFFRENNAHFLICMKKYIYDSHENINLLNKEINKSLVSFNATLPEKRRFVVLERFTIFCKCYILIFYYFSHT